MRIEQFEDWLLSRKEERIVVVGHSYFFRTMVGISGGMDNVSIWQATLSNDRIWDDVKLIHEGCGGGDFG